MPATLHAQKQQACEGAGTRPCLGLKACARALHAGRAVVLPLTRLLSVLARPLQAIDLLDEAGSRVRIATYNARRAGAGREGLEAAATSYLELEQVIATKNEAVQVRGAGEAGRRGGVGSSLMGCRKQERWLPARVILGRAESTSDVLSFAAMQPADPPLPAHLHLVPAAGPAV